MSAVSHAAPPRRVKILPDAAQANSHPLAQQRVGIIQLLQANGNQVPLEASFLQERAYMILQSISCQYINLKAKIFPRGMWQKCPGLNQYCLNFF